MSLWSSACGVGVALRLLLGESSSPFVSSTPPSGWFAVVDSPSSQGEPYRGQSTIPDGGVEETQDDGEEGTLFAQ